MSNGSSSNPPDSQSSRFRALPGLLTGQWGRTWRTPSVCRIEPCSPPLTVKGRGMDECRGEDEFRGFIEARLVDVEVVKP